MSKGLSKEDTKQDHPLQCILLCDTWGEERRWGPLVRRANGDDDDDEDGDISGQGDDGQPSSKGETRPWCLLPLLGVPLLAWSLECLATAGVEQVFIFVNDGVEEVRAWLATSIYTAPHYPLTIVLRPTTAQTPGDVLREVDALQLLAPADFLVVQAGYVGNVDLKKKVDEFAERRKADPALAMSCVVAPRSNATTKSTVHMLAPDSQLLHYEEGPIYPRRKQAKLPREALDGGKEVTVRNDLESIGVQICSVEVPPLFTENFDYQFFYPGFVVGILTSDLLGKTICCTVLGDAGPSTEATSNRTIEWGAVVGNTKSYDDISKALLSRKAFPLAPDENMPNAIDRYDPRRGRVYLGKDLDLSRTASVASTSLIGHSTFVGPYSTITRSVLSQQTSIGASCTITNSYLFAGARIADGCVIIDSIIGEGAVIGEGSIVESGSVVGAGVRLGREARLRGTRVGREAFVFENDDAEDEETGETSDLSLGQDSVGFFWPSESATYALDDDDDDEEILDPRNYSITQLGAKLGALHLSSSNSSLSSMSRSSSSSSLSSSGTSPDHDDDDDEHDPPAIAGLASLSSSHQNDFLSECAQSLSRAFDEGHTVDNAAIELKTLRMASNVPLGRVREVVVPFLLTRCRSAYAADPTKGVAQVLARWGALVSSLMGEDDEEAMREALFGAQRFVVESSNADDARFFVRVLKGFYDEDVVSDEAIFGWYKSREAREKVGGEKGKLLWVASKAFVTALLEAQDDDDDDSDEESE